MTDSARFPGVSIRCGSVKIGPGCSIGRRPRPERGSRFYQLPTSNLQLPESGPGQPRTPGVRRPAVVLECDELVLGDNSVVEPGVVVRGGRVVFGPGCRVGAGSVVRVREQLEFGAGCRLGVDNVWDVRRGRVGRELWTGPAVRVGGGSWAEVQSEFEFGYWCHLGMRVFVNTARRVSIGNEVGIGTGSSIFTHGAYQSALAGYPVSFAPVTIEDNCWIPGAVVNPGVTIGRGAVIGVGSVVTKSVPAGALAAGVPCRVIRADAFPRPVGPEERRAFFAGFLNVATDIFADSLGGATVFLPETPAVQLPDRTIRFDGSGLTVTGPDSAETVFAPDEKLVTGRADGVTEKLRDLLRRYGIRFRVEAVAGRYQEWT